MFSGFIQKLGFLINSKENLLTADLRTIHLAALKLLDKYLDLSNHKDENNMFLRNV